MDHRGGGEGSDIGPDDPIFFKSLVYSSVYGSRLFFSFINYLCLFVFFFQVMYGGRVIDDFDRRVVKTYMDEYMGDFIFDTFQPFHFYKNEEVDYFIPKPEKGTLLTDTDWKDPFLYLQKTSVLGFYSHFLTFHANPMHYPFRSSLPL